MRLWHYELVRVLPDRQLTSQWRELCAIASRINHCGYPHHILVNKVMDYSYKELLAYAERVIEEKHHRHFKINMRAYDTFYQNIINNKDKFLDVKVSRLGQYWGWHNEEYYWQCYYNLQEKYNCGGINKKEWDRILVNKRYFALKTYHIMKTHNFYNKEE